MSGPARGADGGVLETSTPLSHNQKTAIWIDEPGLYDLVGGSKKPEAKLFKRWVHRVVLPAIRKTGGYSLPNTQQPDKAITEGWSQKRLEGIELTKLKNAALKELIEECFGGEGGVIYRIVNNIINQAVVGFRESTTRFKKDHALPNHMSIPDFLDLNGQVARAYAENVFRQTIYDEREQLRKLSMRGLTDRMNAIGRSLRTGFCGTGMGELQGKMLTLKDAREHKRKLSEERRGNLLKAPGIRALLPAANKKQKTLTFAKLA